jgi:hypothetical protein
VVPIDQRSFRRCVPCSSITGSPTGGFMVSVVRTSIRRGSSRPSRWRAVPR